MIADDLRRPMWGEPGYVDDEPLGPGDRAGGADIPPHTNLEAEAALLGGMMIDNRMVDEVAELVTAEDFAEPLHGRLFAAMLAAVARGENVNPITLRPQFADDPGLRDLGGIAYLAQISQNMGGLIAGGSFARQIAELAKRRRLVEDLKAALADAMGDTPVADVAEATDAALNEALSGGRSGKPGIALGQLFRKTVDEIEAERNGTVPPGMLAATLPDLADLVGALRPGEVTVMAGRPGMGKTAAALSIALGCAENGHGVDFISREMSREEVAKRMIADRVFDHGNCPSFDDVKAGNFTADDWRRVSEAMQWADNAPFQVTDRGGAKIGQIVMGLRRTQRNMAARGQKLKLAVIDYLQLVEPDKKLESRVADVGYVSRAVKKAAKDLGIHILLLSQLSRGVEAREDKRPLLSDLRDSGEIEQDADNVIFLYREEYYLKLTEPAPEKPGYEAWATKLEASRNRLEMYSAKRRNGATARRIVWFFLANQAVRGSRYFEDRR